MIAVAGEALIDLVVSPGGQVAAHPGGGPYNAARTLARLGAGPTFLGRLARTASAGCCAAGWPPKGSPSACPGRRPGRAPWRSRPSTRRAVAELRLLPGRDRGRRPATRSCGRRCPTGVTAVHVGTLGLLMEPIGAAVEQLIRRRRARAARWCSSTPTAAPAPSPTPPPTGGASAAIARRANIVKASTEDLAYLYPGAPPEAAAKALLDAGAPLVLVTDGPRPARAFLPDAVLTSDVPAVTVADTIGAGDAFGGGFLGWWTAHGLGRAELVRSRAGRPGAAGRRGGGRAHLRPPGRRPAGAGRGAGPRAGGPDR